MNPVTRGVAIGSLFMFAPLAPTLAHEHHHVPVDFPTIQAAINASGPTDEIEVDPGVYTGEGFWDLDFQGKSVSIVATKGPGTVVIDLGGTHRFANCPPAGSPYVPHVLWITFINGSADEGGFVRADGAGLFIEDCTFVNHAATNGGVIWARNSQVFIKHNTFVNCTAAAAGGAIHFDGGNGYVQGNTFKGCSAESGGAVKISGAAAPDLFFANCVFTENEARHGGAIAADGANASLINCNIVYNSAKVSGGAIEGLPGATLRIINCIVHQNAAPQHSQISPFGATLDIRHCNLQHGGGPDGNIDEVPSFADAANGDYSLSLGSACIDGGENGVMPPHIGVDLVGNPRIVDSDSNGSSLSDIGVIELQVPCDADWNGQSGLTSQDFFDFMLDFFGGAADFNGDGPTNSQDYFDFIAAFFTGC